MVEIEFRNYPIDIIICIIWSIILLPLALLDLEGLFRIIFGLPFILFIPGYTLIFVLFPAKKTDRGIDIIERIALSFGLSIAIVPLIGLILNYTPFGIRLEPILVSIFGFVVIVGIFSIFRWFKTAEDERFIIKINLNMNKSESRLDQALTIILAISILIAAISLVYVVITPKIGEKFTEFYILGSDRIADEYPRNLTVNENASIIIGIANHEYKTINYTIEVWLVNQTYHINESINETRVSYNHMWFIDKLTITLNHTPIDIEKPWTSQWEIPYNISINKTGNFKLAFLLYKSETQNYNKEIDYYELGEEKIDQEKSKADYKLHLWLKVT